MPQPPARPNSTIPLRKLFFKDNSRFLANFLRCSTSLRRCVQKSAGNRRDLIIAKSDRTQNPYRGTSQRRATAPRGKLCWHSPSDRGKNRKNLRGRVGKLPARNVSPRAKGFLGRRAKRRFWLLLPPGAKVARARRARNPPAFPLRGRWQREALTDEVSLRASPQTGVAIRSSRRQPPCPLWEGAVAVGDWGREKTTPTTLRKNHFTCLNCNQIMNGIWGVFRAD